MATTFRARYDGEVLRPEEPLPLHPDATYVFSFEGEAAAKDADEAEGEAESEEPYVLTKLAALAMDMGVSDLAERHDWYAHGRLPDDQP